MGKIWRSWRDREKRQITEKEVIEKWENKIWQTQTKMQREMLKENGFLGYVLLNLSSLAEYAETRDILVTSGPNKANMKKLK